MDQNEVDKSLDDRTVAARKWAQDLVDAGLIADGEQESFANTILAEDISMQGMQTTAALMVNTANTKLANSGQCGCDGCSCGKNED